MTYKVGDRVYFGRMAGEKTLGEVVKVNPKNLRVRQLEARGRYSLGTVWTVAPSLCKPASEAGILAANVLSPALTLAEPSSFKTGDRVEFSHNGTVIRGTVKRVSSKTISVTPDGSTTGRYWRVAPSMLRPAGTAPAAPAAVAPTTLSVGQTVTYEGFSWAARGVAPITGVIIMVRPTNYEVYGGGRTSSVPADKVTKAPRRSDADIVAECLSVYNSLSPECLHMDGEASRTHARNRYAELQRTLRALWKEAGREISESECYRAAQ